jgi:PleD family two-component response regulator
VEEHGWRLPLGDARVLEFQLTLCLHFPGAFVTCGHDAGDRVLLRVVQALRSCHLQADGLHRPGGWEFLLTLPQADAETERRVAERSRQAVKDLPCRAWHPVAASRSASGRGFRGRGGAAGSPDGEPSA